MVKLTSLLSEFQPIKALVIGDFMLDKYTLGHVERVSPEAPVCVLHVKEERYQPGGAGNVVLNLLALSSQVITLGRVGKDHEGQNLLSWLTKAGAHIDYMVKQTDYLTPVKNRIIAENQQIVRVDHEKNISLNKELEDQIISTLSDVITQVKVVCVSDYKKGFLSNRLLAHIIKICSENNVIIIIDPKGTDFLKYKHATVIKPNLNEAYAAARIDKSEPLEKAAKILLEQTQASYLIVTRSSDGITFFDQQMTRFDYPAQMKEVVDVTGAGDTVLAMIGVAMANRLPLEKACRLANVAASIAIEHVGCKSVTLSDLAKRLLESDVNNKIFDDAHIFALTQVLQKKNFSILVIDDETLFNHTTLKAIRILSEEHHLLVYIDSDNPDEDFVSFLAALKEIDFVIFHKKSLKKLCQSIHPYQIYQIKEKDLVKIETIDQLFDQLTLSFR